MEIEYNVCKKIDPNTDELKSAIMQLTKYVDEKNKSGLIGKLFK